MCTCNPSVVGAETGGSLGLSCQPSRKTQAMSSRSGPASKGRGWRTLDVLLWLPCAHLQAHTPVHMPHAHTRTPEEHESSRSRHHNPILIKDTAFAYCRVMLEKVCLLGPSFLTYKTGIALTGPVPRACYKKVNEIIY